MKLSNKQQAEILKVYNGYWDGYLKGDIARMASLLDPKYTQVGSAETEVFFNKKDAVKFLHDTIDQVAGQLEMRKRVIRKEWLEASVLINEQCDLYAKSGRKWIFFSKFRASTTLQKKGGKWKIIHQHSSFPDLRAQDGENIAIEKIEEENIKLKDAIKRRTIELEEKNRELEIETALERVRTQAMAMRKPEDLTKVCKVLYKQLLHLGFKDMRNSMINIHNDAHATFVNYDFSDEIGTSINHLSYHIHPVIEKQIKQIRKAKDAFSETVFAGDDLKAWKKFRKKIGEKDDPRIAKTKALYYYFYSIGVGSIGISTFKPIEGEQLKVLKQFRNVFNLAYQRYTDIAQAEAQAREAKIEAALEKVRSRSLAMHNSSELKEVAAVLRHEMGLLGVEELETSSIYICNDALGNAECWYAIKDIREKNGKLVIDHMNINLKETWVGRKILSFFTSNENQTSILMRGENRKEWINYCATKSTLLQGYYGGEIPERTYHILKFSNGYMGAASPGNISGESWNLLQRVTAVFSFAYTRFLDLQKAEAQAREAQIETALEKVRSRTMAMQRSDELSETAWLLSKQFQNLGESILQITIGIVDTDSGIIDFSATDPKGNQSNKKAKGSVDEPSLLSKIYAVWLEKGRSLTIELAGNDLKAWITYRNKMTGATDTEYSGIRYVYIAFFSKGFMSLSSPEPRPKEVLLLLERFASVFDSTYTRFLDLQKAEAQAREAQIETALERVRSRTMAMHRSDELSDIARVLFQQFVGLGESPNRFFIGIVNEEDAYVEIWLTEWGGTIHNDGVKVSIKKPSAFTKIYEAWKANQKSASLEIKGAGLIKYNEFLKGAGLLLTGRESVTKLVNNVAFFSKGCLGITAFEVLSIETLQLLERFAVVFDGTYTRFLDLQKAETQTREAQIEVAVERVRAKALSMHKSEEIISVAKTLRIELDNLKIPGVMSTTIYIRQEDGRIRFWDITTLEESDIENHSTLDQFLRLEDCPSELWFQRIWRDKKKYFIVEQDEHDLETSMQWIKENVSEEVAVSMVEFFKANNIHHLWHPTIHLTNGRMNIDFLQPPPVETESILVKMGAAFDLAYKRFLDLQKAEAQAREAQIQLALERARTQSMVMQHSNELDDTLRVFHEQVLLLGINSAFSFLWLPDEDKSNHIFWAAWEEEKNDSAAFKSKAITYPLDRKEPATAQCLVDWRSDEPVHSYAVKPAEVDNYFAAWVELLDGVEKLKPEFFRDGLYYVEAFMKYGCFGVMLENDLSDEEKNILYRFSVEFERTYTRFLDLQKAEAQAREAVKQSSLDRVRGEIASMRTMADLDRITPLIWKELTTLGIPFIRCGVFIMRELENRVHTYLSSPDGRAIAAFHTPMDNSGSLAGAIDSWRQQKVFVTRWVDSDFQLQADILLEQGSITSRDQYLSSIPKEGFHLHFLPFRQGMLYVGSNEPLPSDSLQLVQSLADAFSVAYARYEDFTKLETAKQQIEKTLTDLKQTQTQLIQSEKMASLGELTAGIAHEIQNPLNFVNNFSEVSNELIKEIQDIRHKTQDNRDEELTDDLLNDIEQNLQKINHHGKRAEGIVKGMLQHSRSSSGQKESTDINALCDEYLRLSYHGLRARNKDFNAKFETDFDSSLPKLNVVPQDIGRVILNLINNAFYVVNEKHKACQAEPVESDRKYEPTVSVTTKKDGDKVLISVKDNGNGIPQNIVDKIFQPFFTTKPTGQGTGLGLSLSYDIVKAHGGELKVETTVGIGSTFVILLNANQV